MSLPHALLTALVEQAGSGSELARRFDRSIGFFWSATHQQIYRELGRLEEAGLVSSTLAPEARGRKKIYKVLSAGRRELKRWTGESEDPNPLREQLLLRLRAEAVIGPTDLRKEIARRLEIHKSKLASYREIESRDFAGKDLSPENQIRHLILSAGIMTQTNWIVWSEQALKVLDTAAKKR